MNSNRQIEEHQGLEALEQRSNCITFNGYISSNECVDIGGGFVAFNILAGAHKEDFPLCIIKYKKEEFDSLLKMNDNIAGYGKLKKIQGEFVVEMEKIMKIPTDEELNKMRD